MRVNEPPPKPAGGEAPRFVAVQFVVMRGAEHIATARSRSMAQRIAAALNLFKPGKRGY